VGMVATVIPIVALGVAWAQDTNQQESGTSGNASQQGEQQTPAPPTPGIGTENPKPPATENPPISGLDLPGLQPHGAAVSYVQFGVHAMQQADSNPGNALGTSSVHSVSTGLGSVDLQKLWANYNLSLDYIGGAGYYNLAGLGWKQVQEMDFEQRISWKRGQFGVRDSFSYLPEGNFAGAYSSFPNEEGPWGGAGTITTQSLFLGGPLLGALGDIPAIVNLASGNVVEFLTPKSSVTATGGYSLVHYTGNNVTEGPLGQPIGFLGATQVTGQGGYDRVLGPHDQAAIVYGYQQFDFAKDGLAFHTDMVQLMWGHRISGRLDFLAGAGPQLVDINRSGIPDRNLTVAGQASLRYRMPKTTLSLIFERYVMSGSGFFAGALSDVGRVSVARPLGRVWSTFLDVGYAHNSREQSLNLVEPSCLGQSPVPANCEGINATTYDYGFAGVGLSRKISRNLRVYGSYEYSYLTFDESVCAGTGSACNRSSQRHVGTIGLDWTPRPIRLD
jgi:hypothetical protein